MLEVKLSKKDLDKYYFKGISQDKIRKLLRDGKNYYTEEGWSALIGKAIELGLTHDDIEHISERSSIEDKILIRRQKIWSPYNIFILIIGVFVTVFGGLYIFGINGARIGFVLWIILFGWFIFTNRF